MDSSVQRMLIRIEATTAQLRAELAKGEGQLSRSASNMERRLEQFRSRVDGWSRSITARLGALFTTVSAAALIRGVVQTSAEFQRLDTSLQTVTGSAGAARSAFAWLQKFAQDTPFDLQQVVGAFIKLKALGLEASEPALRSYGNTASAMGKELNDFIEAVADASTFEFERLKEFGIVARQQGDIVTFTFQGVQTKVQKSAEAVTDYLRRIGDVNFAGAMEKQSQTLGGALSNLGDAWATFQVRVGEGGLADAVERFARRLSDLGASSGDLARDLGEKLGKGVDMAADAFEFLLRNMWLVKTAGGALLGMMLGSAFGPWGAAIGLVAGGLAGLIPSLDEAGEAFARFFQSIEVRSAGARTTLYDLAVELAKDVDDALLQNFKQQDAAVDSLVDSMASGLQEIAGSEIWAAIVGAAKSTVNSMIGAFAAGYEVISGFFRALGAYVATVVAEIGKSLASLSHALPSLDFSSWDAFRQSVESWNPTDIVAPNFALAGEEAGKEMQAAWAKAGDAMAHDYVASWGAAIGDVADVMGQRAHAMIYEPLVGAVDGIVGYFSGQWAAAMQNAQAATVNRTLNGLPVNPYGDVPPISSGEILLGAPPPVPGMRPTRAPAKTSSSGGSSGKGGADAFGSARSDWQQKIREQELLSSAYAKGSGAVALAQREIERLSAIQGLNKKFTTEQRAELEKLINTFSGLRAANDNAATIMGVRQGVERDAERARLELSLQGQSNVELQTEIKLLEIRNQLRDAGVPDADAQAEQFRSSIAEGLQLNEVLERQKATAEELAGIFDQAFDRIGTAITQAFVTGEGAAIDFASVVDGVVSELIQSLAKLAIVNPLKNFLFGGANGQALPTILDAGGFLGGLFGGGSKAPGISAPGTGGSMAAAYGSSSGGGWLDGLFSSIGTFFGSIFHTGGIVGGGAAGRRVGISAFAGAPRFHGGGLVGLASDEVAAILRRGEEVLPQSDPRHIFNLPRIPQFAGVAANGPAAVTNNYKVVNNGQTQVEVSRTEEQQNATGGRDVTMYLDEIVGRKLTTRGTASNRALRQAGGSMPLRGR